MFLDVDRQRIDAAGPRDKSADRRDSAECWSAYNGDLADAGGIGIDDDFRLERTVSPTSPGPTIDVIVRHKRTEADNVVSLELARVDGGDLPPFTAGAHIDLHLGNKLVRQYSLCNADYERHRYLVAVLRTSDSRGGSTAVHEINEGQRLRISEPRNHFPLVQEANYSLLLAGGIGITPILCMAERLFAAGSSFELHYAARSSASAAFLDRLRKSPFCAHTHVHFDDGQESQKLQLEALLRGSPLDTHLYVCGPTGFMDWALTTAAAHAWPEARLHREYFAPKTIDASADGAFDVKIASTGQVIRIARHVSVVSALAAQDIHLEVSCELGVCGTCLTGILQGTPEHRDVFMNDAEHAANDQFTPCCSRSKSGLLVLDL